MCTCHIQVSTNVSVPFWTTLLLPCINLTCHLFVWPYPLCCLGQHAKFKMDVPVAFCKYNLFQRPWDFWSKFRLIYWMKWETRFSRLNLIIRSIFPFGKKGQLGKKILFYVLQVYNFPFFYNYQQTSYINRI